MLLADFQIEQLVDDLCLIEPYNHEQLNSASYDVTLSGEIRIESSDPNGEKFQLVDISHHTRENPYVIEPGQFFLAVLNERINLPRDISAQFALKSSRAREGFDHALAGFADAGYSGQLTLEVVSNLRHQTLGIWPGMKFGQIKFMRHMPSREPYGTTPASHYQGDTRPTVSWEETTVAP